MENSKIEWCDHTFNPWIGCTKVSDGCKFCYAETLMDKRYSRVKWGPQGTRQRTSQANWRKPLQWDKQAKKEGKRYRVFCASLADVFEDNDQLRSWRRDLIILMENTPNLDWLLLTKRPENVMKMIGDSISITPETWLMGMGSRVWIGASIEDQDTANKRILELLKVPAAILFLSCEPLLGTIDFQLVSIVEGFEVITDALRGNVDIDGQVHAPCGRIDWVIVGGESGQHARPMELSWVRFLKKQCDVTGVKFFMKQLGGIRDKRHNLEDFPEDLCVREFPE